MYAYQDGKDVIFVQDKPASNDYIVVKDIPISPEPTYILKIQGGALVWAPELFIPFPSIPPTVEELQKETSLLKAQLKAQTESSTFLEDCLAEMALQVYK